MKIENGNEAEKKVEGDEIEKKIEVHQDQDILDLKKEIDEEVKKI